jgi:outer membrane protein assembly factor BamD
MKYFLFVTLFLTIACSSKEELTRRKLPEEELTEALQLFKDESYEEAKTLLFSLTIRYSGTKIAEDAQYYLGKTYFAMEKFLLSADAYSQILERYSQSQYLEDSQFQEAYCFYNLSPSKNLDQKYTNAALTKLNNFLTDYPNSKHQEEVERYISDLTEKLAEKFFTSAFIYYKMERWNSAIIYTDQFINKYKFSKKMDDTYFLRAKIFVAQKQWVKAEQEIEILNLNYSENDLDKNELNELILEISEGKKDKLKG